MQPPLDLSISMISFNTKQYLKNCLNSILENTKNLNFEILLVDNGSKDGSAEMVQKKFPKVKIIKNRQNLLFIKAHNQNLRRAKGRYFLLLNEDALIGSNVFEKMIKFLDKNPKIGLASCRQVDEFAKTDNTCSSFPIPASELLESSPIFRMIVKPFQKQAQKLLADYRYSGWDRKSTRSVDVLPGSFIIGRKKLIEKIGYLDEDLLFFYGEADYCQRAKKTGYQIYHNAQVSFVHLGSRGLKKLPSFTRYQILEHDILVYYKKYFGFVWWLILWIFLKPNWLYWRFFAKH